MDGKQHMTTAEKLMWMIEATFGDQTDKPVTHAELYSFLRETLSETLPDEAFRD